VNSLSRYLIFAILLAALTACGPSLAERKKDADIHFKLGAVHLNDGNYIAALTELTRAIEKYPDDPSFHNALGLAYMFREMNREAEGSIKTAIRLDPDFSEAHVALSSLYRQDRDWDAAIDESKLALANIFYKTPEFAHPKVLARLLQHGARA
jgi:Flp pilus assembly protein TadD